MRLNLTSPFISCSVLTVLTKKTEGPSYNIQDLPKITEVRILVYDAKLFKAQSHLYVHASRPDKKFWHLQSDILFTLAAWLDLQSKTFQSNRQSFKRLSVCWVKTKEWQAFQGWTLHTGHPHVWSSNEKLRDKVRTFAERAHHQPDPMALWMNLHTQGSTMTLSICAELSLCTYPNLIVQTWISKSLTERSMFKRGAPAHSGAGKQFTFIDNLAPDRKWSCNWNLLREAKQPNRGSSNAVSQFQYLGKGWKKAKGHHFSQSCIMSQQSFPFCKFMIASLLSLPCTSVGNEIVSSCNITRLIGRNWHRRLDPVVPEQHSHL